MDLIADFLKLLESLAESANGALDTVRAIHPALRILAAGTAVMLQLFLFTNLFVPANTILFVTASAVATPTEGALLAVAVSIGGLMGSVSSYALARWPRSARWWQRLRSRHAGPRLAAVERFTESHSGPTIIGARFIPVLRTVVPFAVGLSNFPPRRFLVWCAAASVCWAAVYIPTIALLAAPLRDKSGSVLLSLGLMVLGFAAFSAGSVVQYFVERARKSANISGV